MDLSWIADFWSDYVPEWAVALTYFIEKPFQNWTVRSAELIGTVFWYLDYTAPIDAMRSKLDEFVRESKHWDKKLALIQVTDSKASVIEVRALVSAAHSGANWDLRCEVREKMIAYLKEHHPQCLPRVRQEQYRAELPGRENGSRGGEERRRDGGPGGIVQDAR